MYHAQEGFPRKQSERPPLREVSDGDAPDDKGEGLCPTYAALSCDDGKETLPEPRPLR